ncbi:MAG: HAD family hydrolase [Kiritimatiellae bacterium]|nr:HAD family hydrolase [Kiritimatiellia bacterium]
MNAPRILLLDWNGTLQDDVLAAVAGTNAILADQGSPPIDVDRYRAVFSFPARGCYEALGIEVDEATWPALCDRFFAVFSSHPSVRLVPGAAEALRLLRAAGVSMCVVSASDETELRRALARHGVADLFDSVCGQRGPFAGSKVERALALFAELGVSPADALVVGDTGHDAEVAAAIGCGCVLVETGYESRARLLRHGVPVIGSVADLPAFLGVAAP